MNTKRAIAAIESILTARMGSMGKLICEKERSSLGKPAEAMGADDIDTYIMRIVEAISPVMGRVKAHEVGNELSGAALSALYGGEGAAGTARERKFQVIQAFIIYSDGRLLAHTSAQSDASIDKEIVSSMLTAVQSFVAESLGKGDAGALDELRYGNTKILISREGGVSMAVVVAGEDFGPVRHYMRQALKEANEFYSSTLASWSGNTDDVKGLQYYTDVICLTGPVPPGEGAGEEQAEVAAPAAVQPQEARPSTDGSPGMLISSEVEFYGGYIRLKAGVKNHMPTVVTNVAMKLAYDEGALRLDRVEPLYEVKGGEIILGNIGSQEKKSVSVNLDPLICMDSYIDGLVSFRDAAGSLETVKMKRKLVSVVCPMLFTDGEVNVAMLKRLVEQQLHQHDSRMFKIPPQLSGETVLAIGKGAVSRHDIRLVREFRKKGEPYSAEAWYHAHIKGRSDTVVVRVSVWKESNAMELFVASESLLVITGLLAELRHDIGEELEKRSLMRDALQQLIDRDAVSAARHQPLLLSKEGESEAGAGETEQNVRR